MKKVIVASLCFLGAIASAETLKGKALENQVVKMGYCVGAKNIEGREYSFKSGGKVTIRVANSDHEEADGAYENEYENAYGNDSVNENVNEGAYEGTYEGAYGDDSDSSAEIQAHWSVKGASVKVHEGKDTYDLAIGFKSKTCWIR